MTLEIAPIFQPFLEEALLRFSYLHPGVAVASSGNTVDIQTSDASVVAAFQHTLYRQKIYRETSLLRNTLIESLLR